MDGTLEKSEKNINAEQNTSEIAVNKGISVMPEHTSHWLVDFYQHIQKNFQSRKKCGILKALENGVLTDDPFEQV